MSACWVSPWWIRVLRLGFAALGVVALLGGPLHGDDSARELADSLSYFTIQANILGVLVLLVGALFDPAHRWWQLVRGAATVYLFVAGIVYAVLLTHMEAEAGQRWADDVLHRIMPIVMIVDWVLAPVALAVSGRLIAAWLVYPLVYGTYTLIRGPIVDWYPYPFLDPRHQGYVSMTVGLVILVIGFALVALAVAAFGELSSRWRRTDE